jgi:hypothetical protein
MVKAVSNNQDTERFDLKTLPGAYIVARRLSYGEKLQRRAMVSNFKVKIGDKKRDTEGEMNFVNEQATLFDFQHCIVEHNLDRDDQGNLLNFSNLADIRALDPRVGEEIDNLLDKMNNFDDEDESGN